MYDGEDYDDRHYLRVAQDRIRYLEAQMAYIWDDGYVSGHSNAMRQMSDEPGLPPTPNPYRLDKKA